jgi:2-keto-4-pentenoate hydratase/2-oxohepta-3-ene-1,7-dioic acid hydratase in catechol pathway
MTANKLYRIAAADSSRYVSKDVQDGPQLMYGLGANGLVPIGLADGNVCRLEIPVTPPKIIGVGNNFGPPEPSAIPSLFFMPPSALIAAGPVVVPDLFDGLAVEGELGVVLKSGGRHLRPDDVSDHILGYVVVNDFSGRAENDRIISNGLKKGCDGLLPIGPALLLHDTMRDFQLRTFVNERLIHSVNTADMRHSIPQVVAFVSRYISLDAGDLICMGAAEPKPIAVPGDTIRIEIDALDALETTLFSENKGKAIDFR